MKTFGHYFLITITAIGLIAGILDLVMNAAIIARISNKDVVTAVHDTYLGKHLHPTIGITPSASTSATPAASPSAVQIRYQAKPFTTITPSATVNKR